MYNLSSWVMSVAGISVLSVIVDLIMPNGQTKKYIKGVFAFIIIFILISPLPSLIGNGINVNDIFQERIELQDGYFYQINSDRLADMENSIKRELKSKGITNIGIHINANIFSNPMDVNAVFVDLSQVVINENNQHIDINDLVKSSILKFVTVEVGNIIFDFKDSG